MANQYTVNNYSENEINKIISLYINGMSFSKIGLELGRKKSNIKKILIKEGVFIEDRDIVKRKFNDDEINNILFLYVEKKLSLRKISKKYGVSVTPIKRILNDQNVLRFGNSDGKKIYLSNDQKNLIKNLYLIENKNCDEIGNILGYSSGFVSQFLLENNKLRNKSEGASIGLKKRVITPEIIQNMKRGQRNLVLSGKRKQTGGVCKKYDVSGIICYGKSEKKYVETLINENKKLPKNCSYINTPFGAYYPDFKYNNKFIEIKSTYTYDILLGYKKSRWTKKYETTQLKKIKWVNENIMPVIIIVVDKNNLIEHKI